MILKFAPVLLFDMALETVNSRFAILPDDDEESGWKSIRNRKKSETNENESSKSNDFSAPSESKRKNRNRKKNKGKGTGGVDNELKELAFGGSNSSGKKGSGPGNKSNSKSGVDEPLTREQYETWKQKDQAFVESSYEQDLQAALQLSKLELEKEKGRNRKGSESDIAKDRKKGSKTITLDEFNKLSTQEIGNLGKKEPSVEKSSIKSESTEDFFDSVQKSTQSALRREKETSALFSRSAHLPESALLEQMRAAIVDKDLEIDTLNKEVSALSSELAKTKKKYKQFREFLEKCETKETAQVVAENMKLKKLNEELTHTIESLQATNEKLNTKLKDAKS